MRMVKQLGAALVRIMRLRDEKQYERAHEEIGDTCDELLGHQPRFLEVLDARSAARMLSRWFKIKAYAALLEADAEIYAHECNEARAEKQYRRALEVFLEGLDLGGRGDPDIRETVTRLQSKVDWTRLGSTYRNQVQELRE